jgi:ribosome recycling factor
VIEEILAELRASLDATVDSLHRDLGKIRAGRAAPGILDSVMVDYYGAATQLKQLATVSAADARSLVVQPFDQTVIGDVEKAIRQAELGLSPMNDGRVVRVSIPELTEERRKDLVRQARKENEKHKISARSHRRDANDLLKGMQADKEAGEDEVRTAQDKVQKLTDACMATLDVVLQDKEKDILAV